MIIIIHERQFRDIQILYPSKDICSLFNTYISPNSYKSRRKRKWHLKLKTIQESLICCKMAAQRDSFLCCLPFLELESSGYIIYLIFFCNVKGKDLQNNKYN